MKTANYQKFVSKRNKYFSLEYRWDRRTINNQTPLER